MINTHAMDRTEKNKCPDGDRNMETNEDTEALDALGEVIAIKDLTDQVDAVMRAGRTIRPGDSSYEYPPELKAYYRRTKEEVDRRMEDLAERLGTSVKIVQEACRVPWIIFEVLDDLDNSRQERNT